MKYKNYVIVCQLNIDRKIWRAALLFITDCEQRGKIFNLAPSLQATLIIRINVRTLFTAGRRKHRDYGD